MIRGNSGCTVGSPPVNERLSNPQAFASPRIAEIKSSDRCSLPPWRPEKQCRHAKLQRSVSSTTILGMF